MGKYTITPAKKPMTPVEYMKQCQETRAMLLAAQAQWLADQILAALPPEGHA